MTAYTPNNSHDPKTDHRSLAGLAIAAAGLLGLVILWPSNTKSEAPAKLYTVDGCDIYRFTDGGDINYIARCSNGNVATTYDQGRKHAITETK